MFCAILDLLMHTHLLSPGSVIRLLRCSKGIRELIKSHHLYWKVISCQIGHKRFRSNEYVMRSISLNHRCRECGMLNGRPTYTVNAQCVSICGLCVTLEKTYNELVSRKQIFATLRRRKHVISSLSLARITLNRKHLYWGYQFRKMLQK